MEEMPGSRNGGKLSFQKILPPPAVHEVHIDRLPGSKNGASFFIGSAFRP